MLEWDEVDPYATWPEERYRAVSGKHEYRIFLDPEGEHIFPEPDAKKVEWWALVVREDMENGVWRHVVHRAKRTLAEVKRDAEQWEGQPHDKARGYNSYEQDVAPAAFH